MLWVFVFALAIAIPLTAWYWFFLTPLQKQYLVPFAWNQSTATGPHGKPGPTGPVWLVYKTAPKRKPELAHDGDIVSATKPTIPAVPMKLSPRAEAAGWTDLTLTKQIVSGEQYEAFLKEQFFAGKSLVRWLLSPVLFGAALFLLLLGSRAKFGFQSDHEERHGRRTKGPELGSALRSGRMGWANGIRFRLEGKLGLPGPGLRIPRKLESSHILLMGDRGAGSRTRSGRSSARWKRGARLRWSTIRRASSPRSSIDPSAATSSLIRSTSAAPSGV